MVFTLTNLKHVVADSRIPDSRTDQVILIGALTRIGLLINPQA